MPNRKIIEMVQKHLSESPRNSIQTVVRMVCVDGFSMSVQASKYHYCSPRNNVGPWTHVEIGFPSGPIPQARDYREGDEHTPDMDTVFAQVPISVVADIIWSHGGEFEADEMEDGLIWVHNS